jgi:hypothetical protein
VVCIVTTVWCGATPRWIRSKKVATWRYAVDVVLFLTECCDCNNVESMQRDGDVIVCNEAIVFINSTLFTGYSASNHSKMEASCRHLASGAVTGESARASA